MNTHVPPPSAGNPERAGGTAAATVKVWDLFTRIFHWGLVASFAIAYLSAEEIETLHVWAGYAAAALIAWRLVWGVLGPGYARFAQFVKPPAAVLWYLGAVATGHEPRYIGHNPAGGAMVVALLAMLAGLSATGIMMTTSTFEHSKALEEIHDVLANVTLGLVALHVAGVALASVRHHENLVRAMITGRKRPPTGNDVA